MSVRQNCKFNTLSNNRGLTGYLSNNRGSTGDKIIKKTEQTLQPLSNAALSICPPIVLCWFNISLPSTVTCTFFIFFLDHLLHSLTGTCRTTVDLYFSNFLLKSYYFFKKISCTRRRMAATAILVVVFVTVVAASSAVRQTGSGRERRQRDHGMARARSLLPSRAQHRRSANLPCLFVCLAFWFVDCGCVQIQTSVLFYHINLSYIYEFSVTSSLILTKIQTLDHTKHSLRKLTRLLDLVNLGLSVGWMDSISHIPN